MNQYMLVLWDDPSADAMNISPDEIQAVIAKYHAWSEALKAKELLVAGEKLCDEGGRQLRRSGDATSVTDGPFSEAKEVVGGFYILRAESYEQAVELCHNHPHLTFGKRIDIRQIEDLG